jgi:Zn-dependent protease
MLSDFNPTNFLLIALSVIIALVIHEFMHAYAAHLLGDTTAQDKGRLSLNPLSHIDPFMTVALPLITLLLFHYPLLAAKPVPFNPDRVKFDEFGAALIAAAGPFSNLLLALIAQLILTNVAIDSTLVNNALSTFTVINVELFVFNLIPIPPLDGSRILYAFAPAGLQQLMSDIEPYGLFIIFGLVLLAENTGFLQNLAQFILNILP